MLKYIQLFFCPIQAKVKIVLLDHKIVD